MPLKGAPRAIFLTVLTTSYIAALRSLAVLPSILTMTPQLLGKIVAPEYTLDIA